MTTSGNDDGASLQSGAYSRVKRFPRRLLSVARPLPDFLVIGVPKAGTTAPAGSRTIRALEGVVQDRPGAVPPLQGQ